jgi:hypothetical protein
MKVLNLSRYALCSCVAAAMLAGCGGSQPPIGAPGAMPQASTNGTHAARGWSWMLAKLSMDDLIYAVGGCGGTCVLSYPSGTLVGSLNVGLSGACVDSHGHVFITNNATVVEYAHGDSTPIETLTLPGDAAIGCSVDPTTGNLAVIFNGTTVGVAIFPGAQGTPMLYAAGSDSQYCGYDDAGNLFVDGYVYGQFVLTELQKGSSSFATLSVNGSIGFAGQVQWDQRYLTVLGGDNRAVKLFFLRASGSTATIVKTTNLNGIKFAYQSWIYSKKIFIPFASHGTPAKKIGIWNALNGRKIANLKDFGSKDFLNIQGVAFSPGP